MEKKNNIFEELKRRIIEAEYKPGELLNEKELLKEFNVSRTPVREAILKLSYMELVKSFPRAGTYVTQIDIRQVINAYEVKIKLEALSAELATKRITEEEIKEVEYIIDKIKKYDLEKNYKECIFYDQLFHKKIREASKNVLIVEYLEKTNNIIARFLHDIRYVIKSRDWYDHSLDAIIEAIKENDSSKAGKEAEKHVHFFLDELSTLFKGGGY